MLSMNQIIRSFFGECQINKPLLAPFRSSRNWNHNFSNFFFRGLFLRSQTFGRLEWKRTKQIGRFRCIRPFQALFLNDRYISTFKCKPRVSILKYIDCSWNRLNFSKELAFSLPTNRTEWKIKTIIKSELFFPVHFPFFFVFFCFCVLRTHKASFFWCDNEQQQCKWKWWKKCTGKCHCFY